MAMNGIVYHIRRWRGCYDLKRAEKAYTQNKHCSGSKQKEKDQLLVKQ